MKKQIIITIPDNEVVNLTTYAKTNRFVLNSENKQNAGFCRVIKTLNSVDLLELTINEVVYNITSNFGIVNNWEQDNASFTIQPYTITADIPQELYDAIIGS